MPYLSPEPLTRSKPLDADTLAVDQSHLLENMIATVAQLRRDREQREDAIEKRLTAIRSDVSTKHQRRDRLVPDRAARSTPLRTPWTRSGARRGLQA